MTVMFCIAPVMKPSCMQWRYWRLWKDNQIFFFLNALLLQIDMSKQGENRLIKTREESQINYRWNPWATETHKQRAKSQSMLRSTDHPVHNVLSQSRRFGNRLILHKTEKGKSKSVLCAQADEAVDCTYRDLRLSCLFSVDRDDCAGVCVLFGLCMTGPFIHACKNR